MTEGVHKHVVGRKCCECCERHVTCGETAVTEQFVKDLVSEQFFFFFFNFKLLGIPFKFSLSIVVLSAKFGKRRIFSHLELCLLFDF